MEKSKKKTQKPPPVGVNLDGIPKAIREEVQWVLWLNESHDGRTPTKVPYAAKNHRHARTSDKNTWTTFNSTCQPYRIANGLYSGIGFVFTEDDPYIGIDLEAVWKVRFQASLFCMRRIVASWIHASVLTVFVS